MSAINKAVTPWLITEYGIDWNNVNTATLLLVTVHAIVLQQLGRYPVSTFPTGIASSKWPLPTLICAL